MAVCLEGIKTQFLTALFNGLAIGSIYALIALGLSMVYGVLGLINFAHGDVFMVGSFTALGSLILMRAGPGMNSLSLIGIIIVASLSGMIGSGITAMLLELIAYRPLRLLGAPRHAGMISGMGASMVLEEIFGTLFGRNVIPYPEFFATKPIIKIGYAMITNKMLIIFVTMILMCILLNLFVGKTIALITFLVGGLVAGQGGFLYSLYFTKTRYNLGFMPGIKGLSASILGGVGNLYGAVLGGLALGLIENIGSICIPSNLKDVISFVILILVLLFKPTGILGSTGVK
jgi:branched-chain amino acid transport system permease protein